MVIYLLGEHGYRTAYSEEEAKLHEKDGYVRKDLSVKAIEDETIEVDETEKPKRTRRTKAEMNELRHD